MFERSQTIRQAAELWIERCLDAINLDIIARLMEYEPDKWCENLCANRGFYRFDNRWLKEWRGLEAMSECGFRIYEHDDFGFFFGIDGAGYDFYEAH
ncbi:MAG: hypothetical protein IJG32_03045 [Selenomonadaceae bacterium]|nr:hypothetical protein [Selenomonadaceae bacterium]